MIAADLAPGPARQMGEALIHLPEKTQAPFVPSIWVSDKVIRLNSWDRLMIPKPFSKIIVMWGEPVNVPEKLNTKDAEIMRTNLTKTLSMLEEKAYSLLERESGLRLESKPKLKDELRLESKLGLKDESRLKSKLELEDESRLGDELSKKSRPNEKAP